MHCCERVGVERSCEADVLDASIGEVCFENDSPGLIVALCEFVGIE